MYFYNYTSCTLDANKGLLCCASPDKPLQVIKGPTNSVCRNSTFSGSGWSNNHWNAFPISNPFIEQEKKYDSNIVTSEKKLSNTDHRMTIENSKKWNQVEQEYLPLNHSQNHLELIPVVVKISHKM